MDLSELKSVFGNPTPPQKIWEIPFEGDKQPLRRLCAAKNDGTRFEDLVTYALDLTYVESLQPDLLTYLFPLCLDAWRKVMSGEVDSTFNEHFHRALAERNILEKHLTPAQRSATLRFMREALLELMDKRLDARANASTLSHHWMLTFSSYATFSPDIQSLWLSWWEMTTSGRALASLQYASCLIYPEDENPFVVPYPWEHESIGFDEKWRIENIEFLSHILTVDYLEGKLRDAASKLLNSHPNIDCGRMLSDFRTHKTLVGQRLKLLPKLLATPTSTKGLQWE